jgi:hypothetical protein
MSIYFGITVLISIIVIYCFKNIKFIFIKKDLINKNL